jgi:hypothetical protein
MDSKNWLLLSLKMSYCDQNYLSSKFQITCNKAFLLRKKCVVCQDRHGLYRIVIVSVSTAYNSVSKPFLLRGTLLTSNKFRGTPLLHIQIPGNPFAKQKRFEQPLIYWHLVIKDNVIIWLILSDW